MIRPGFARASFQRAMLDNVTPGLRGATVDLTEGVRVRFVYADAIDEEIRDIVDEVETVMMGDFPDDIRVVSTVESIPDGPIPLSQGEITVFHRREPAGWDRS